MKKALRIFCCIALVLLVVSPANSEIIKVALKDILPVRNIQLQGMKNDTNIQDYNISIPERWRVKHAILTFSYSCSTALIKKRSRLIFSLGDTPLHQVALDPKSPQGTVTAHIPGKLLKPGYHALHFTVIQHSVDRDCEDPSAPELWTWVELSDARISFDVSLKPVPKRISAVSQFLFDSRNLDPEPVNLVFPTVDKNSMKPVALCASGTALRYNYRPVSFSSQNLGTANMDTILIGPEEFIKKQLLKFNDISPAWNVSGPFLEIRHLPMKQKLNPKRPKFFKDVHHPLIIVTGKNWKEVEIAAKAYSMLSLPLPDASSALIHDIIIPELTPQIHKNILEPEKEYSLASLGFRTYTFRGFYPISNGFSFWLPTDSHLPPNSSATLSLNMTYGASMREDSVLNIKVNDTFVSAIPCNDEEGGDYRGYKVQLLVSSLHPGYNRITFVPQLTPLHTDKCTMIQDGNLQLTIFGNSTLTLPALNSWIEMPNIRAFMDDAFPYNKYADMREVSIIVPDQSRTSFITAVSLVSIMAQKTGFPPLGVNWYLNNDSLPESDVICVSKTRFLPPSFVDKAPIQFKNPGLISSPHLTHPKGHEPKKEKGFWSSIFPDEKSQIIDVSLTTSEIVVTKMAPVVMRDKAALLQFESPTYKDKTVTLLTTHSDQDMEKAAEMLWDNSFKSSCEGDTVLVNLLTDPYDVLSLRLGSKYHLGAITPLPFIERYTNTYLIQFIALITGLCLLLALLAFWALRRRNKV